MASARSRLRILLTFTACVLLAALAWTLVRRPASVVDSHAAPAAPPPVAAAAPAPAAPATSRPVEISNIPLTKLPLRLVATVVNDNAELSLATLVDLERDAHEVMSEGQTLEGRPKVRIASIERERVLLDNDGVREQLVVFHGAEGRSVTYEPTPEQREQRRELSHRLRELTDAGKNYRDVLGPGTRGGLLAEGDLSAAYEDGEMIGVQVDGIREGGVYDKIGLRNGDVVTDVNGVALSDPSAAAELLVQVATSPTLEISAMGSDGTERTLSIPTEQFRKDVQALGLEPHK
jgi:general secretion pathway protein C